MKNITAKMLKERGACKGDVAAFKERWPKGCRDTRENCQIAFLELGMSKLWVCDHLLSDKACADYQEAVEGACEGCGHLGDGDCPEYCAWDKACINALYRALTGA